MECGCCLLALLALLTPRVILVLVWLFTDYLSAAFNTWLWPVLGFVFMPYTTLAYMGAELNTGGRIGGLWLVLIVVAVLADLGAWGGGGQGARRRRPA